MLVQTRLDRIFAQNNFTNYKDSNGYGYQNSGPKFTLVVPSNDAWEKAQMNFHKAYNILTDGQMPQYASSYSIIDSYWPMFLNMLAFFRRLVSCRDI